jgi:hypothetical protein
MSDAPETIWAGGREPEWFFDDPSDHRDGGYAEYTRTDIAKDQIDHAWLKVLEGGVALVSLTVKLVNAKARIAELEAERVKDHANINLKADWIDRTMNDMALDNERIAELEAVLAIAESALHEHDTACYEYGEENPWVMGEWFDLSDREAIAKARSSVPPENAALKEAS